MLRYRGNVEPPWQPTAEALAVAREHVAWARRAGFCPSEVLEAIGRPPRWFGHPSWGDVELSVARAWSGVNTHPITATAVPPRRACGSCGKVVTHGRG